MQFGDFKLSIIRECSFKLDGGAMFGVVPKTLWNKVCQADQDNRVLLMCNLLLIQTGNANVLIETGMGNRWDKKETERYEINSFVDYDNNVLAGTGLQHDDIDYVFISHLHFDHAGGATRFINGKLEPTYPKAKYIVQKGEWDFAHKANARAKASYRFDDFNPLQDYGLLQLVEDDYEIVPGIKACKTGGHTAHHQVITFQSGANIGVYFADIIPTAGHLTPPWVMGYDHFPLDSCDLKSEWLAKAASEDWLVVFDHEPGIPWGKVAITNNKFKFSPEESFEESILNDVSNQAVLR